tara:strand:- start:319 stop:1674 length:1356 start_codon:yes stop_codon:yes gene_type:complete
MKEMEDNSVDSIVTDPPYGLSFMGKEWDYDVPSVEIWREALRVLKPGGHLLAFSGTRTYHRMVVNIEDAGFEIRDSIVCWLYFSGFPKSHNISKAIDKAAGAEREVIGQRQDILLKQGADLRRGKRKIAESFNAGSPERNNGFKVVSADVTAPATPEAKQWDGWGTALKPAHEPVCVARKPLIGTVAENVLEHGTGALNIDGCRVGDIVQDTSKNGRDADKHKNTIYESGLKKDFEGKITVGRWPSNVIMDEVAGAILNEQAPSVGNMMNANRKTTTTGGTGNAWTTSSKNEGDSNGIFDGLGGGSRFFYCPKVSQAERNAGLESLKDKEKYADFGLRNRIQDGVITNDRTNNAAYTSKNNHPTVKPISLMRYLAKLVTKEGGIVLDPFMGSGSTGIAACLEGFNFVGIEMDEEYLNIARHRIAHWGEYEIEEAEFIPKPRSTQMNISDWF